MASINPLEDISSLPDRRQATLAINSFYSDPAFPDMAFRYRGECDGPRWEVYTVQRQTIPDDPQFVGEDGTPVILGRVSQKICMQHGEDPYLHTDGVLNRNRYLLEAADIVGTVAFWLAQVFGEDDPAVMFLTRSVYGEKQ